MGRPGEGKVPEDDFILSSFHKYDIDRTRLIPDTTTDARSRAPEFLANKQITGYWLREFVTSLEFHLTMRFLVEVKEHYFEPVHKHRVFVCQQCGNFKLVFRQEEGGCPYVFEPDFSRIQHQHELDSHCHPLSYVPSTDILTNVPEFVEWVKNCHKKNEQKQEKKIEHAIRGRFRGNISLRASNQRIALNGSTCRTRHRHGLSPDQVKKAVKDVKTILRRLTEKHYAQNFPRYFKALLSKNPMMTGALQLDHKRRFFRMFISVPEAKKVFEEICIPFIFVDGSFSRTDKYDGVMLHFIGRNGFGANVPIADAWVPAETASHCFWALQMLSMTGIDIEKVPFQTDRGNLLSAVRVLHSVYDITISLKYCLEHILRNIVHAFKLGKRETRRFNYYLGVIAAAKTMDGFFHAMEYMIDRMNPNNNRQNVTRPAVIRERDERIADDGTADRADGTAEDNEDDPNVADINDGGVESVVNDVGSVSGGANGDGIPNLVNNEGRRNEHERPLRRANLGFYIGVYLFKIHPCHWVVFANHDLNAEWQTDYESRIFQTIQKFCPRLSNRQLYERSRLQRIAGRFRRHDVPSGLPYPLFGISRNNYVEGEAQRMKGARGQAPQDALVTTVKIFREVYEDLAKENRYTRLGTNLPHNVRDDGRFMPGSVLNAGMAARRNEHTEIMRRLNQSDLDRVSPLLTLHGAAIYQKALSIAVLPQTTSSCLRHDHVRCSFVIGVEYYYNSARVVKNVTFKYNAIRGQIVRYCISDATCDGVECRQYMSPCVHVHVACRDLANNENWLPFSVSRNPSLLLDILPGFYRLRGDEAFFPTIVNPSDTEVNIATVPPGYELARYPCYRDRTNVGSGMQRISSQGEARPNSGRAANSSVTEASRREEKRKQYRSRRGTRSTPNSDLTRRMPGTRKAGDIINRCHDVGYFLSGGQTTSDQMRLGQELRVLLMMGSYHTQPRGYRCSVCGSPDHTRNNCPVDSRDGRDPVQIADLRPGRYLFLQKQAQGLLHQRVEIQGEIDGDHFEPIEMPQTYENNQHQTLGEFVEHSIEAIELGRDLEPLEIFPSDITDDGSELSTDPSAGTPPMTEDDEEEDDGGVPNDSPTGELSGGDYREEHRILEDDDLMRMPFDDDDDDVGPPTQLSSSQRQEPTPSTVADQAQGGKRHRHLHMDVDVPLAPATGRARGGPHEDVGNEGGDPPQPRKRKPATGDLTFNNSQSRKRTIEVLRWFLEQSDRDQAVHRQTWTIPKGARQVARNDMPLTRSRTAAVPDQARELIRESDDDDSRISIDSKSVIEDKDLVTDDYFAWIEASPGLERAGVDAARRQLLERAQTAEQELLDVPLVTVVRWSIDPIPDLHVGFTNTCPLDTALSACVFISDNFLAGLLPDMTTEEHPPPIVQKACSVLSRIRPDSDNARFRAEPNQDEMAKLMKKQADLCRRTLIYHWIREKTKPFGTAFHEALVKATTKVPRTDYVNLQGICGDMFGSLLPKSVGVVYVHQYRCPNIACAMKQENDTTFRVSENCSFNRGKVLKGRRFMPTNIQEYVSWNLAECVPMGDQSVHNRKKCRLCNCDLIGERVVRSRRPIVSVNVNSGVCLPFKEGTRWTDIQQNMEFGEHHYSLIGMVFGGGSHFTAILNYHGKLWHYDGLNNAHPHWKYLGNDIKLDNHSEACNFLYRYWPTTKEITTID